MHLKKQEMSSVSHKETDVIETDHTQSTTDLHSIVTATNVKDRVTAINTRSTEDQTTKIKPVVPRRKRLMKSQTPVQLTTDHTSELQAMFLNKRSDKEVDEAYFEEYVRQGILKQRQSSGNIVQHTSAGGGLLVDAPGHTPELLVAFKKQQERFYVHDTANP